STNCNRYQKRICCCPHRHPRSKTSVLFGPRDPDASALRSLPRDSSTIASNDILLYQMTFETSRVIPPDHPSLACHFPDGPIVPGVVVLDEVVAALAEWRQDSQLTGIPSVKFIGPI